ncbi:MAG: right-handed parallel beta-helix repeat-containing protein [Euryarchaeota archaeon]|nr:right-handed parallel beta-helix repeat-containing protein [Euryarchaeota archaeon]
METARSAAIVLMLALAGLSGCLTAPPTETVVAGDESHSNEEVVLRTGILSIPAGSRYEVDGGALRLNSDPAVVVNGVVEVRGALVVRNAAITNLFRLTAYPGSTLELDHVRITGGAVYPSLYIRSQTATITASTLDVSVMEVTSAAELRDNEIRVHTSLPAVYWHDAVATFTGNRVEAPGFALLFERVTGEVSGNTVSAGLSGVEAAIAVRGGQLAVVGNMIVTAAVGIGAENANVEMRGNTVRGTSQAGVALVATKGLVTGNTIEGNRRAGVYLKDCTTETRVEGNRIQSNGDGSATDIRQSGAGVAVDGGSASLVGNDFLGNDNGVAILNGTAVVQQNNFEGHRLFAVVRDIAVDPGAATAAQDQLDASNNWWGAASGPVASAPGTEALPGAPGADRVGPGVNYAPWLTAKRA